MQRYTERDRQTSQVQAPTQDLAIVKQDGIRTVRAPDQTVIIPYFQDTNTVLMKSSKPVEWKDWLGESQAVYFPYALYWEAAFTEGSIKQALYDSGITVNKMGALYQSTIMQRGMRQSGGLQYHLLNMGWWDYQEQVHDDPESTTLRVRADQLDQINFSDVVTAYGALWAMRTIELHDLGRWVTGG
jgi:hypothetical protein